MPQRVSRLGEEYLSFFIPLIEERQELGIILGGDSKFIARILMSVLNSPGSTGAASGNGKDILLLEQILLHGLTPEHDGQKRV